MGFPVTEAAMRPASKARACFYCNQPVGDEHAADCVLILKRVKVRFTVEYEVDAPAGWDAYLIEFHRNDGSWCVDNVIPELETLAAAKGCLCNAEARFEYLGDAGEAFLKEDH